MINERTIDEQTMAKMQAESERLKQRVAGMPIDNIGGLQGLARNTPVFPQQKPMSSVLERLDLLEMKTSFLEDALKRYEEIVDSRLTRIELLLGMNG
jgi:uncharacterized coiled-coil protein SlyX